MMNVSFSSPYKIIEYEIEDEEKWKKIIEFECRGLELIQFSAKVYFILILA